MQKLRQPHYSSEIRRNALAAFIVWTLTLVGFLAWNIYNERRIGMEMAENEAVANISKDEAFRRWAASHGGVYVPPDENTPPNPYLSHLPDRDITTNTGKSLTLMNPAYMLRQVQKRYAEAYGVKGRITSLRPLNPINAPDEWETKALKSFEQGEKEVVEAAEMNGKPHLRMMQPFIVEPGCLKCHAQQGYKVGDIRGGIEVSVPLEPYYSMVLRSIELLSFSHGMTWLIGVFGIQLVFRRSVRRAHEREEARQALLHSQKRFQTVADYALEWDFWRNPDGTLNYVSPSCESISGFASQELYDSPELLDEMVHPEDQNLWQNHVHQADRNGHPSPIEFRIIDKQGSLRWISHVCRSVFDEAGDFIGVRGTNIDISDRKRTEDALEHLNATLEQRVKEEVAKNREKDHLLIQQSRLAAMGEMMHNIAHQWRQPLTALSIILGNIRDDYRYQELTPAALDGWVRKAHRLLHGMSATIDDFRDFFRPDQEPKEFDIGQAVDDAMAIMKTTLDSQHIAVTQMLATGLKAYGYPNQFAHAVLNLIANARDAIQLNQIQDGRIEIRLEATGNLARLTVQDNAGGIPIDILARIFDPYFTTKEQGTGIGLYMTKMIIDRNLKGAIEVANLGEGALFTLSLPLLAQDLITP